MKSVSCDFLYCHHSHLLCLILNLLLLYKSVNNQSILHILIFHAVQAFKEMYGCIFQVCVYVAKFSITSLINLILHTFGISVELRKKNHDI